MLLPHLCHMICALEANAFSNNAAEADRSSVWTWETSVNPSALECQAQQPLTIKTKGYRCIYMYVCMYACMK